MSYPDPVARVMGVDVGSARVGIALSDEMGLTARPFRTIPRRGTRGTARTLAELAAAEGAGRIVVGLPLGMDGGEQASSADARDVAEALRAECSLEVILWDERLTSAQAERALIEGNMRRDRRRQLIDQVAAAILLQSFLDMEGTADRGSAPGPAGGERKAR